MRELLIDHGTGQLISRPIAEYAGLHTAVSATGHHHTHIKCEVELALIHRISC